MSATFEKCFEAETGDIDVMGHVNNAVWVRWMEDVATAHWESVADPAHVIAYAWVVTRHEIDYRGNIGLGEAVTARTWIEDAPRGARFDRHIRFVDAEGREKVRARTTWAMIDLASGRIMRVPAEITAPFLG
ncbi:MAG TPA: acyl-CoA thioesterase [Sphingobium sp.]|uniref:acyl-CoA thioesterase n=1 Tax=Sphingobium sp. TaxID=1912891 RepID=UPI002ED428C2